MTSMEMAKEFITTMNPENATDGRANFAIYEFPLPYSGLHLEVCFLQEDFDDNTEFRTLIEVVGSDGCSIGLYTFVETMTDVEAVANGIEYVLGQLKQKWKNQ